MNPCTANPSVISFRAQSTLAPALQAARPVSVGRWSSKRKRARLTAPPYPQPASDGGGRGGGHGRGPWRWRWHTPTAGVLEADITYTPTRLICDGHGYSALAAAPWGSIYAPLASLSALAARSFFLLLFSARNIFLPGFFVCFVFEATGGGMEDGGCGGCGACGGAGGTEEEAPATARLSAGVALPSAFLLFFDGPPCPPWSRSLHNNNPPWVFPPIITRAPATAPLKLEHFCGK